MKAITKWHGTDRTNFRLEWDIQYLWVGATWDVDHYVGKPHAATLHIWICLLPCLPIHIARVLT